MNLPPWNLEFERGLEVGTLRRACRLLLADAFDQDKTAVLAVRWWMRPSADTFEDMRRHLIAVTGVTQKGHRTAKARAKQ